MLVIYIMLENICLQNDAAILFLKLIIILCIQRLHLVNDEPVLQTKSSICLKVAGYVPKGKQTELIPVMRKLCDLRCRNNEKFIERI